MRTKLHVSSRAEEFPHEEFERAFQICDTHIFIDVKTFDLVEMRTVRGADDVSAIRRAGCDHANWRRRRLHRANLYSGGVRSQQPAVWQIKCILLIARRVFGRCVECIEAMPLVFDVWSVSQRESHSSVGLDRALEYLCERMERAPTFCCSPIPAIPSRTSVPGITAIARITRGPTRQRDVDLRNTDR